jgi:hypothetical protein
MGVKTDPHTPGPLRESSKFLALRALFALCHSSARAAAGAKLVLQRQQFHGGGTGPAFSDPRSTGAAYRGLIANVCVCN